jgi:hypothetical protein
MLDHDPTGVAGPSKPQPDVIRVAEPKEEEPVSTLNKGGYARTNNFTAEDFAAE